MAYAHMYCGTVNNEGELACLRFAPLPFAAFKEFIFKSFATNKTGLSTTQVCLYKRQEVQPVLYALK